MNLSCSANIEQGRDASMDWFRVSLIWQVLLFLGYEGMFRRREAHSMVTIRSWAHTKGKHLPSQ